MCSEGNGSGCRTFRFLEMTDLAANDVLLLAATWMAGGPEAMQLLGKVGSCDKSMLCVELLPAPFCCAGRSTKMAAS